MVATPELEGDRTAVVTQAGSEPPSSQGQKEGSWMKVQVAPRWYWHLEHPPEVVSWILATARLP